MTETPEPLVSNPWHAGLQQLRTRLLNQTAEISTVLDDAAERMGGGWTWTGPVASRFGTDVEGNRKRLRNATQRLVEAVETELRRTPERVPASQAKLMRMDLQGY